MINKHHWFGALTIACAIHVAAFISLPTLNKNSAKDKGELGIEVDLGMLGDLGVAMAETVEQHVVEQEPEPVETPPEPVLEEKVINEPEPEPVIEHVEIEKAPVEEPKDTVQIKKKVQQKPQPVKQVEPQKPIVKTIAEPVKPTTKMVVQDHAVNKSNQDNQAAKKLTTGSQNTISTGGNKGAERSYFSELSAKLARHKRYPNSARRKQQEGTVTLFFVVNRQGKVLESYISESSGYKKLDDAVLRMLKQASPLPAFPAEMKQEQLTISIPIAFKLNDKR